MTTATYKPTDLDFEALENAQVVTSCQRTPEWFAARRGRFTGSEIWKLMTEPRSKADKEAGKFGETAMTYIYKVLAESVTEMSEEFSSAATQWGIDYENEAREVYEQYFMEKIEPCDFIPFESHGGGSPDGFIGDKGIAEIKCPYNSGGHIENLVLANKLPTAAEFKEWHKEYYWQIQNNLMATGRDFCRFISYDPRFVGTRRIACITIPRVEADIDLIRSKVISAALEMKAMKKVLAL